MHLAAYQGKFKNKLVNFVTLTPSNNTFLGNAKIIELLIQNGAVSTMKNNMGQLPRDYAVQKGFGFFSFIFQWFQHNHTYLTI